jgi:hypothetical protein
VGFTSTATMCLLRVNISADIDNGNNSFLREALENAR